MNLTKVIASITHSRDREGLKSETSKVIAAQFSACRHKIVFFDEDPLAFKMFMDSKSVLAPHLIQTHSPAHEGLVISESAWALRRPGYDHGHVMAGPIVGQGNIIGIVALTRESDAEPFSNIDLRDLGAICAHLSTWKQKSTAVQGLTERERQIADLVGQGRTNSEISEIIHITANGVKQALKRMFRKLKVSSRAALIARLNAVD